MKAAQFDFAKPSSLAQAVKLLNETGVDCKIMAGSQSLGPMLNLRLARPDLVLDISGLGELRSVTQEGETIRIGACVTHAQVEDGIFPPLRGHPWQKVAAGIAYRSVRNRGTVGGSLAHADPAADWVVAAAAMNAEIEIKSTGTARRTTMQSFMLGAYSTALESGDVITALYIPAMHTDARWGYFKFCRKIGEFSEASCAAYFDPAKRVARIVLGALHGAPQNLPDLASVVSRTGWNEQVRGMISEVVTQALPDHDRIAHKMFSAAVTRCLDRAFGDEEIA